LKPGSASAVGRLSSVIVSPTRVSATCLIWAVMIADLAGAELVGLGHLRPEHADAVDLIGRARPIMRMRMPA
jgi:hypothetical protein